MKTFLHINVVIISEITDTCFVQRFLTDCMVLIEKKKKSVTFVSLIFFVRTVKVFLFSIPNTAVPTAVFTRYAYFPALAVKA